MADLTFEQSGLRQSGRLRHEANIIGLLFASTTSIVGSGWLFGSFHAARIAGPLAVWSWVAGAVIIMLIALCFAELAVLFPRSGALVHMSHASHGESLGRIWGWMLFLSYVPIAPVEAEAVITYANNYFPHFLQPGSAGLLNPFGFAACAFLIGVFCVVNLLAVGLLLRINTSITWWKLAIPALTGIALIVASTRWGVMKADPGSYRFSDIFVALPSAGIVFSYLGFRTAIDLGGESSNPSRHIPLAVIGSVALCAILYILLQFGFLLGLRPGDVAHGWSHLNFAGSSGPFAGLAAGLGMTWLAVLLYIDAYVSPGGTGLIYVTGSARVLFALGETDAGPSWLTALTSVNRSPWAAILLTWVIGILFLLPFPAWQLLVGYITSITVLTYGLGPIALLVLRKNLPEAPRRFRLWGARVIAPIAFICSNLVIYWTGFRTNTYLFGIVFLGLIFYALHFHFVARRPAADFGWRNISWLFPWFCGMWLLSGISNVGHGAGWIGFWTGVFLVVVWSLIVVAIAERTALIPRETLEIMAKMDARA